MAARKDESQARKDHILSMTIEYYIKNVLPVSSNLIATECPYEVSSATVRNIFAELEEEGFLTHPHTSAGRIPTHRGYRYYVDHLMNEINLLEEEKVRIKSECEREKKELELLVEKASKVLSETTHYTSIISIDGLGKVFYRGADYVVSYPDFQDLKKIKFILSALEEKEKILELINQNLQRRVLVLIGQEIQLKEMDTCSLVITSYQTKHGPSGRLAILGPTRMNYERVVSALEYFTDVMEEIY